MTDAEIVRFVQPYTLVSEERIRNVLDSVQTIVQNNIDGDLVEIGVWRGGLIMAMALKCMQLGVVRRIHAFDTFQGMTEPSADDVDHVGNRAADILDAVRCYCGLEEVRANVARTGYGDIVFHPGDILKTNLEEAPEKIALLRLDTDWYDLTRFELQHFEPRVPAGGRVIIDDYGHWKGCRKAVDEFLEAHPEIQLQTVDYTGRWWAK